MKLLKMDKQLAKQNEIPYLKKATNFGRRYILDVLHEKDKNTDEGINTGMTKKDNIEWVIDAFGGKVVKKINREAHKYDEVRADQDLRWCPECKRKWEIYEGKLWASRDRKLFYKEEICPDCVLRAR